VNNWDLAMLKNFSMPWFKGEHSSLQSRWETFKHLPSHPIHWRQHRMQWPHPSRRALYGPDNLGNGEVSGSRSPHIMQLGMKFIF